MGNAATRCAWGARIWMTVLTMQVGTAQAGDPGTAPAAAFAATCAACHGTAGHALPGATVPGLAGIASDRLRDAMRAFRDGTRGGTVMPQIAKGYSDEQIAILAAFFAAQPVVVAR